MHLVLLALTVPAQAGGYAGWTYVGSANAYYVRDAMPYTGTASEDIWWNWASAMTEEYLVDVYIDSISATAGADSYESASVDEVRIEWDGESRWSAGGPSVTSTPSTPVVSETQTSYPGMVLSAEVASVTDHILLVAVDYTVTGRYGSAGANIPNAYDGRNYVGPSFVGWWRDWDGDGSADPRLEGGDDCDDDDETIYPGATEIALDGIDQDCDGADDCGGVDPITTWDDLDEDGYGDPATEDPTDCTLDAGEVENGKDCDDDLTDDATQYEDGTTADMINPDATEVWYNDIDEDCDGNDDDQDEDGYEVTEDCNDTDPYQFDTCEECESDTGGDTGAEPRDGTVCQTWCLDGDQDTHGTKLTGRPYSFQSATQPPAYGGDPYVQLCDDCNDDDDKIKPGVDEVCGDRIDNDCDNLQDDDDTTATNFYADADCDTYGAGPVVHTFQVGACGDMDNVEAIRVGNGPTECDDVTKTDDCDPAEDDINPGETEIPGDPGDWDEDCKNGVTCYADVDDDGERTDVEVPLQISCSGTGLAYASDPLEPPPGVRPPPPRGTGCCVGPRDVYESICKPLETASACRTARARDQGCTWKAGISCP